LASDADILHPQPIEWAFDGGTYRLKPRDIDDELMFQSWHSAWAIEGLDATRGHIGEEAWERRSRIQQEEIDSNRFAFGGGMSLRFLTTPEGMARYIVILSRPAAVPPRPVPSPEKLAPWLRANGEDARRLAAAILRRDFRREFPNVSEPPAMPGPAAAQAAEVAATGSSPATAAP
jgi:hypothetical protein